MAQKSLNISVIGVSGGEHVKGHVGVGKSLLCNRFIRPAADDFHLEHCSVLSQTDFGGSPVINNDHWLYWGERILRNPDDNSQILIRIVEQTEFVDDETFEPIACTSKSDDYPRRCSKVSLSSRDKLMYIQKEQLGLEADYPQHVLPDGRFVVDAFVVVCDVSRRAPPAHGVQLAQIFANVAKTKRPVVVALAKCDEIDEEAKRGVVALLAARKEWRNVHQMVIEISAVHDVNIEELFHTISSLCIKSYKHKRKPLSYYEAAHYVEQRNVQIKNAYANLLSQLLPIKNWASPHRFGWSKVLSELDRHRDFANFLHVYGSAAAYRMYEKYTSEAKELWMNAKLRSMLADFPRILRCTFEKFDIAQVEWIEARDIIRSHALFDEFFRPIGSFGCELSGLPTTPSDSQTPEQMDKRLPAEILMLPESKEIYNSFRDEIRDQQIRERLEEEFECLLADTPQVTPGKSMQDSALFIQGSRAFESLSVEQASEIYNRYQRMLVKRAEMEFTECLMENIALILRIVSQSTAIDAISIDELTRIKDELENDRRYRWMSKIFDLRDHLIYSITSFYRQPSTSKCPTGVKCVDHLVPNTLDRFFHRRNDHTYTHLIDTMVHGEPQLVSQFINELSGFLRNEPFPCAGGSSAFIRIFGEEEMTAPWRNAIFTNVYLINSTNTIETIGERVGAIGGTSCPPIFVVVCDATNFDTIPIIHQQGASLAAKIGASFFGSRGDCAFPSEDLASTNIASDTSSLLGRDQLMGICESICSSQLTLRRRDLRVQISLMCGDQYAIDSLIASTFGDFEQIAQFRPIVHPNLLAGGVVPIDVLSRTSQDRRIRRVEIAFGSYHSWFSPSCAFKINSTQGHVLVYYTRRIASFAHAQTAVSRLLTRDDISPRNILIIAICDRNDHTDPLLIEGAELCDSIGSRFIAIQCGNHGRPNLTDELIAFFDELQSMVLSGLRRETQRKGDEGDGLSSIGEQHSRPTTLHIPDSNHNANGVILGNMDKKKRSIPSKPSHLKMRESRISRSGPVFLTDYRKTQPDIQIAPLATPEAVEIAPEYSLVKDALTSDEGLYETLDFQTKHATNHLDLPADSSNVCPFPDALSVRPRRDTRRSQTAFLLRRTTNLQNPRGSVRQSLSAESIVELVEETKKMKAESRNRFVRKVATSFRFRKDKIEEKRENGSKIAELPTFRVPSRSLPQSPQIERKNKIYNSLNNTTEKMVSSAFSWLPSRSPKRHHKGVTCELNSSISSSNSNCSQGVIAADENLDTLCSVTQSGIPIYVKKCVEFIENNGGFEQEGLYRVPGNQAHLAEVERKFVQTGEFDVSAVDIPVHVAATALKNFFSCLPDPLIPVELHAEIKSAIVDDTKCERLGEILSKIPETNRKVLRFLTDHLRKVAASPKTVMDMPNLSRVWFPTLFRPSFDTYEALSTGMAAFQLAMEAIFVNSDRILS